MVRYLFQRWEDGSTNLVRTLIVTSDMSITATYVLAPTPTKRLTYQSAPINVNAQIDSTPIPSGSYMDIPEGTHITITIPAEVEA